MIIIGWTVSPKKVSWNPNPHTYGHKQVKMLTLIQPL